MVDLASLAERVELRLATALLAAGEKAEPVLMRLDPKSRAKVIMALLALVLVGVLLVAMAIIGGRSLLRIARKSHGPTPRHEDDWYRKPLVPKDSDSSAQDLE